MMMDSRLPYSPTKVVYNEAMSSWPIYNTKWRQSSPSYPSLSSALYALVIKVIIAYAVQFEIQAF